MREVVEQIGKIYILIDNAAFGGYLQGKHAL
jgi:hypothetical protein